MTGIPHAPVELPYQQYPALPEVVRANAKRFENAQRPRIRDDPKTLLPAEPQSRQATAPPAGTAPTS